MFAQTPPYAPFVVLAFLATILLLVFSLLAFLIGLWLKKPMMRYGSLFGAFLLVAGYGGTLLVLSLLSPEVVLPPGGRKYFCEIDCHIAYTIDDAVRVTSVGGELQQVSSKGVFVVVGVKSWFDPATISPQRGNSPLTPNSRRIAMVDDQGRLIAPSARQGEVLEALRLHSTPLSTALRPGESYMSYFVFEVPSSTVNPKLLLASADRETRMLLGHENSLFHKKIYFSMPRDIFKAAL